MKKKRSGIWLMYLSIGSFFVLSISFLLMPVEDLGILPGILFWLGLVSGLMTQWVMEFRRRAFFRKYREDRRNWQKAMCGALSFGANPLAKAADIGLAVSIAGMLLAILLTGGSGYACYIMIALTVFSFSMHSILNGRNYYYLCNQSDIRQALDQKKTRNKKNEKERESNV